jgi:hypothetical protein
MSAIVIPFPRPMAIRVQQEPEGGWLVTTHRGHGWLHGNFGAAMLDAQEVANGFDLTIRSTAGRRA